MVSIARQVLSGGGPFELRPLCIKGDLKNMKEYWHRFCDQLELKQGVEMSTPLHEASRRGYSEIVEYLLSNRAKVNETTSTGKTALYLAAEGEHSECEMLLIHNHQALTVYQFGDEERSCFDTEDGLFLKFLTGNIDDVQRPAPALIRRGLITAARLENFEVMERVLSQSTADLMVAIQEAVDYKKYGSVAFLKLVLAVVEGDKELISNLYSSNTTKSSIPSEVKAAVLSVPTKVPLELARLQSKHLIFREILIHTNLTHQQKGMEVHWNNLGVYDECISDLYVLQKLTSASVLSLAHNTLTNIEENFEILSRLTVLDLSSNNLSFLHPSIFLLPRLWSLNLSHNSLTRLPIIEEPQVSLTHLDLSNNNLERVPSVVQNLSQVSYLNLSYNPNIKCLPMWITSLPSLNDLRIDGLVDLDPRCKDTSTEVTLKFLQTQAENSRKFYEMKMIVTGVARAGKSLLVNQLRNIDRQTPPPPPPVGVSISNWLYQLSKESKEYEFNVWDIQSFGQKEVGVAMEEIFYTPFAMYIIVFDLNTIKQNLLEISQRLNAIASRYLPSCVLFVGTHLDLVHEELQLQLVADTKDLLNELISGYPKNLLFFAKTIMEPVSLAPGKTQNIEEVRTTIFNLSTLLHCDDGQPFMGRSVLLSGVGLKGEVEEYSQQVLQGTKPPILTYEDIEKLVSNLKDIDVQSHDELGNISQFLNRVGCLLHFHAKDQMVDTPTYFLQHLRDAYFMDPLWLYSKVQSILLHSHTYHQGLFHYEDLKKCFLEQDTSIASSEQGSHQGEYLFPLVAMLVHLKLLIPLQDGGNEWFVSPLLLRDNLVRETDLILSSITFSFHQQYVIDSLEDWTKFLLSVLDKVTPLQQVIDEGQKHTTLICWKKGIAWFRGKQALCIRAEESNDTIKIVVKYTCSLEYTTFLEEVVNLVNQHFPDSPTTFLCTNCIVEKTHQIHSFSTEDCVHAIVSGKQVLSCSNGHQVTLEHIAPFLTIQPTNTMDQLKLDLEQMHYFSSTSSYLLRYNAKFRNRKVLILKYHTFTEKALREISSKSVSLSRYNTPCLSNQEGRLLGLAIDTKQALLVCEVPPLGLFSAGSLSENPVVTHSCVLYRMAVQLAKALTKLPHWLPNASMTTNLQFWNLDENSLIHCTLVVSDECLRMLVNPLSDTDRSPSDSRIETWTYYMRNIHSLAESCISINAFYLAKFLRPGVLPTSLESLVSCFSSVPVQLITDVQSLSSLQVPIQASVVPSLFSGSLSATVNVVADLWMSSLCQGREELRICVYSIIRKSVEVFKVKSNPLEVLAVEVCNDHVWISTQLPDDVSCVSMFNTSTKKLVHNIKMTGNAITCIERVGTEVCAGTKAGFLFVFPDDVYAVKKGTPKPRHKFIGDGKITGLASIGNRLYIAHSNCIYVFDPENMKFISSMTTVANNDSQVGRLYLSQYQPLIYSVGFTSTIVKAWDIAEAKHLYDINVYKSLVTIGESPDTHVTTLTAAIDNVWIGLATGHIMVFHNSDLVIWMRPYKGPVNFLSRFINGDGCTVISGGERYLSPVQDEPLNDNSILLSWKAYSRNILLQLKALEESGGEHLDSFESLTNMVNGQYGFQDITVCKESLLGGTNTTSAEDTISVQLPNKLIISIPACSARCIESLLDVIQYESLQLLGNTRLVYHFEMYDTLVNIDTDDDLISYLELPHRPILLFVNDNL